jgi:hypothetical protein
MTRFSDWLSSAWNAIKNIAGQVGNFIDKAASMIGYFIEKEDLSYIKLIISCLIYPGNSEQSAKQLIISQVVLIQ